MANNRTQTESVTPVETDKLLALLVGGRYSETENLARSLIDRNPMSGFVWKILGIALSIQGKSALYALQKTAEFLPGDAEAHNNLAMALRDNDQLEEAVNSFRGSLEIKPDFAGAYANLGNALKDIGHLHEAAASCRRALEIKPDYAEANSSLGNILHELRQFDAAAASFRRALELRPDFAEAHSNLGHLLRNIGQTERAAASCQRALEIDPNFADAALNLSLALRDLDQLDSAVKAGRLAVHIKPDCANASFNLSALLLAQGQFAEAWPLYEFRHKLKQGKWGAKFPDLTFPQWRGESLAGKSLLIWPEQGYGDYVQFVRYAPLLKQMGVSRLTLACSVQLKALLETVEGADMVTTDLESIARHDYWTFPLSLPLHFGTTIDTIPAALPYLNPPSARVQQWRDRLPSHNPTVGLVWKGYAEHKNDIHRSLPHLVTLAPLWDVPGAKFISLQKGQGEDEALQSPPGLPLIPLGSDIVDFADTAAIVAQLDLVICVDTAIAHVAGALGKPCWVLLPALCTDWRWLSDRSDSPWYPGTMRLFRQLNRNDWSGTIRDVTNALKRWVSSSAHQSATLEA